MKSATGVAKGRLSATWGLAYAALGETRKAIEFYEKALEIAREIGDRRGEGHALGNLGTGLRRPGRDPQGDRVLRESTW